MMQRKSRCGFTLISKNVGIKQSIIPEFISGSSTQAVTQEKQPAWKTLNKFQGLSDFITPRGFTLIEVLVVVLIIGVLAAIALPMYNRAVLRSRFNALMPIVKAMNDSNEAYYLEHGSYASNPQDLPVQGQSSYPTGTELELGSNMDYAYVLAYNADAKNNYIMYQKHSTNYPGEIHCEAITGDDLAEYICESAGGTQNLGTTLTNGYTTYVIQGTGFGLPALATEENCRAANAMGLTCNISTNEQGKQVKQVCKNGFCRTKTFNEDGSYTSVTCQVNSEGICTNASYWRAVGYDANGNKLTERKCSSLDSSGNCTEYSNSNSQDYTYDANGNQLSQRNCSSLDSSGNCTAYSSIYNHTYDANGNSLTWRQCSSADSSGICTEYQQDFGYNYTYDANGNRLSQRECKTVDSSGNCTAYDSWGSYDYTYDANGNKLSELKCNSVDSSGNCTAYSASSSYNYTYDENGNNLSQRKCSSMNSSGNCTAYSSSGNYDYTYDANGNKLTQRQCSSVGSGGNCTAYKASGNYDYTYDANGNQLTRRTCNSVGSNGSCAEYSNYGIEYTYDAKGNRLTYLECNNVDSSGNCTAYSMATYYTYDDNGKQISEQRCSGSYINTATGECSAYNNSTYVPFY